MGLASKQNLEILESAAKQHGMDDAVDFLYKVRRLSAVDTYLSSFIEGIQMYTKQDGKLHVRLLQHRTATGRFLVQVYAEHASWRHVPC